MTGQPRQRGRLGRGRAVGVVAGAGLLLFGSTLPTWITAQGRTTVGAEPLVVGGSAAAPGVASAALLVLVAGVVLALAGRVARILAVAGVIIGGALAATGALLLVRDPGPAARVAASEATGVPELLSEPAVTIWPYAAVVLGILVTALGALLPFLLGRWRPVARRYDRTETSRPDTDPLPAGAGPSERAAAARVRAVDDWDALSRGDDPSEPPDAVRKVPPDRRHDG